MAVVSDGLQKSEAPASDGLANNDNDNLIVGVSWHCWFFLADKRKIDETFAWARKASIQSG